MLSPLLSEATSNAHFSFGGMFLFFFFAFALAAAIWFFLWMLSSGDSSKTELAANETPEPAPAPEPKREPAPLPGQPEKDALPEIETVSEVHAAEQFSAELADGSVRQDPVYGIVYNSAPPAIDDLKKIKGVARVLEGKLNGVGVYRFKQIAFWTDTACKEFSKMLTFKDRIYRDNWIAQAKEFHREKYGEDL